MRSLVILPSLLLAAGLAGCGGDSTDPSPQSKPVASLSVLPGVLSLTVGQTGNLTAEVRDAAGTTLSGRSIIWSTADAAIATVSTAGVVSAVAPGTAAITATSEGKSGSATVAVTPVPVASITVTPSAANVMVGGTLQLSAATLDASGNPLGGRTVSWSSSNPLVTTVSPAGLVSAVSPGTATITAGSEAKTGSAVLTIIPVPVASVTVAPNTLDLIVGETGTLAATAKDSAGTILGGRPFTWTSESPTIATVSASGEVTAVGPGQATVTATSEGKSASVTVNARAAVASVAIAPTDATMNIGAAVSFTATPRDADGNALPGRVVSWSTDFVGVASISSSGVVTAVAPGVTTIRATSEGKSGAVIVTVLSVPVASVLVSPGAASVEAGVTMTLTATPKDAGGNPLAGRPVAWTSANAAIAIVSQSGVVTAIAQGTTTISASSGGRSGRATITVTPAPVATVVVLPGSAILTSGQAQQFVATLRDTRGIALTGRTITWTTSKAWVATVSTNGVATGVGGGTATITATSEGRSGHATIAVPSSFHAQAVLSNDLVVDGSPITYSVDFGMAFSAITEIWYSFTFGDDALDMDECLEWRGGFCNPDPAPQTTRTMIIPCVNDPELCDLFRDGVDSRQIVASRNQGSGAASVRITSLSMAVFGTPLP